MTQAAVIALWLVGALGPEPAGLPTDRPIRVLCIGDSTTEGGPRSGDWRFSLWERLLAGGWFIEYGGSRTSEARTGAMRHEGYGGKNVQFLAAQMEQAFPSPAPDIVLLHAGHNNDAAADPVPDMLAATERIILRARAANPRVIVLLAQVIPSFKLPKYSYIPAFNAALPVLAARLSTTESPVHIVDQATGFDPAVDTLDDLVHPNASGREKIVQVWFDALGKVLPRPEPDLAMPVLVPYKSVGDKPLHLHVFHPAGSTPDAPRPAIVFFYGGGWSRGTPIQFYPEARHFARRGYVAITVDYRVAATHAGATPFDALADAKSAIRFVRAHAAELGIDPQRVIGAGASAGGHLAAAALSPAFDDPSDDTSVSAQPDALILWYPVIDNGPTGYGAERIGDRYPDFSPFHLVERFPPPPTLVFLGTKDVHLSVARAQEYQQRVRQTGARCELELFENSPHAFYDYRNPSPSHASLRSKCLASADAFLRSLGYP
jgi:acetyl esterase/lipase